MSRLRRQLETVTTRIAESVCGGLSIGAPTLEHREPGVDSPPSRAHQIDEQRQIVYPRMSFREKLSLDSLEPADGLVEKTSDFGDVACHGEYLGARRVADRGRYLHRNRRLELCGRHRQGLDLLPGTVERGLQVGRLRTPGGKVREALFRPFQSQFVHERRGYSQRRMDTAVLEYDLPEELIAQTPTERRDDSRLLVYRRRTDQIEHRTFADLPALLERELVVLNDTRVVPARLRLRRESGGAVEVFLLERRGEAGAWEGLARPSKRLRAGEQLGPVELLEPLGRGRWLLHLEGEPAGDVPLPPYIHRPLEDPERYQTVYAREAGSAAAPTAGLHFTRELLRNLDHACVTLHVGLDTFQPVTSELLEGHTLHGERYSVASGAWRRIAAAERVLAVGTTAVRVVETVVRTHELDGRTTLFVKPGFDFRRVDALLTNFHLPRSTPLALVMAFAGIEETRELYRAAIAERYRFFSFGDAMLVL